MPTIHEAHWRHANLYLSIADNANDRYKSNTKQDESLQFFDDNIEQIDSAFSWLLSLSPTEQTDLLLIELVDAVSSIGMVRYNIREKLIPLQKLQIAACQRLSIKEFEADAIDGLGIFYAYLGDLPKAVELFEQALEIANQAANKDLAPDIQNHIRLAQEQLGNKNPIQQRKKISALLFFIPTWLKLKKHQIKHDLFGVITTHNQLGEIYLDLSKFNLAERHFQYALMLSQQLSFRIGQLEASMGILQTEMSKAEKHSFATTEHIKDLSAEFEWHTDIEVLETLIDLAPTINELEMLAEYFSQKDMFISEKIYQQLDAIMFQTNKIITASGSAPEQKQKIFKDALLGIKQSLESVLEIRSSITP
jgi:tetratricopeptide (TPR) repeat protein